MSRVLYPGALANSPEQVVLRFRFQINGTSAPDNLVPAAGGVTSVARSGAGVFAITFDQKYPVFIGMTGSVLENNPAHDLIVKCAAGGYSATTGILSVTVVGADGSTAAEDPANDDWVYIEACFCRRNSLAPTGSI